MQVPDNFPLKPIDAHGRPLAIGRYVSVLAVASCACGLPQEDQSRLLSIVGERRQIVEIDSFGFIWLSFSSSDQTADFCLLPTEVAGD